MADKAYSSKANRAHLRGRGITAVIPVKDDQAANRRRKGSRGGRPPSFDAELYKQRNTVERCINKLRQHRAVGEVGLGRLAVFRQVSKPKPPPEPGVPVSGHRALHKCREIRVRVLMRWLATGWE